MHCTTCRRTRQLQHLLGNYEGPHDHDIAFAKVAPILVKAKPMALVVEAANPRHAHEWGCGRMRSCPTTRS